MNKKPESPRAASPQKVRAISKKLTMEKVLVHVPLKEPALSVTTFVKVGKEDCTITNTEPGLINPHLLSLHLPTQTLRFLRTKNVNVCISIVFLLDLVENTITLTIYGDVNYNKTETYTFIYCLINLFPKAGLMKNGIKFSDHAVSIHMTLIHNKFINYLLQMLNPAVRQWVCEITF